MTATRWRVPWGYVAGLLLLVLADPTPFTIAAGIPLVLLGEMIRIVANGSLVKDKKLTTWGLYAHIRHPLYLGSALIAAGFIIMAWSIYLACIMAVLFIAVYLRTIRREEEKMEELFGVEYLDWTGDVPRFIPRRWAPREIDDNFILERAWANREQKAVLGVIGAVVILYLKYLIVGG